MRIDPPTSTDSQIPESIVAARRDTTSRRRPSGNKPAATKTDAARFELRTLSGKDISPAVDDNVDILIELADGRLFFASFFTIRNLQSIAAKYRSSGECANGRYVWSRNMVVVDYIERSNLELIVGDLISSGQLESCCASLKPNNMNKRISLR